MNSTITNKSNIYTPLSCGEPVPALREDWGEVVSDRKEPIEGSPDHVDYHEPWVLSVSDFYVFGSLMPGRIQEGDEYRYGFNGMEGMMK